MQQKYELGTRLTYLWYKNEKKISLNFILVFEPLRFWHTCRSFLLSKFASQIKLIQSLVGSVTSNRVLGSHLQGFGCQRLVSQGPRVPGPGYRGPRSLDPRSVGLRVPAPGSQVLILDYALKYMLFQIKLCY